MSSEPMVEVRNVTKTFNLGETVSLQHTLRVVRDRIRRRPVEADPFVALDDVSFEIERGECFAILGSNGSGKSTLAKIIAGITPPSAGRTIVRGRVLPLLGIAAGFHPELTGRENVTLFGTILGLSHREIVKAIPNVMEFAEIRDKHLDTPVKRFSEGMKTRLSFATALRLDAEISIFDEVLAVADDRFKAVCLMEIANLVERGRTIIFISHELALIESACSRAMWLNGGVMRTIGPVTEVAPAYERFQLDAAEATSANFASRSA